VNFLFRWKLLALALLFGGASIMNLGSAYDPLEPALGMLRLVLIAAGLGILFPLLLTAIANIRVTAKGMVLISLWLAFGAVGLISSVVTEDHLEPVASMLWILAGIPIIFFAALPGALGRKANQLATLALLISHAFYLLVSLLRYPQVDFQYKGIFGHPNEMGMTATVVAACCLTWLTELVQTQSAGFLKTVALTAAFCVSCLLVLVSGSRTSLLAVLVTTLLAAFLCAKQLYRKHLFSMVGGGLVLLAFSAAIIPNLEIAQQMWHKHMQRVMKGDMLSNRDEIWLKVIDDVQVLGNGSEYFPDSVGISSHNSLIHIIGQRGPIAAFFMAGFAVVGAVFAFQQAVRTSGRRPFASAPLLIASCFWALSSGEGVFGALGTGINLAYLLSIGLVLASETEISVSMSRRPLGIAVLKLA